MGFMRDLVVHRMSQHYTTDKLENSNEDTANDTKLGGEELIKALKEEVELLKVELAREKQSKTQVEKPDEKSDTRSKTSVELSAKQPKEKKKGSFFSQPKTQIVLFF